MDLGLFLIQVSGVVHETVRQGSYKFLDLHQKVVVAWQGCFYITLFLQYLPKKKVFTSQGCFSKKLFLKYLPEKRAEIRRQSNP